MGGIPPDAQHAEPSTLYSVLYTRAWVGGNIAPDKRQRKVVFHDWKSKLARRARRALHALRTYNPLARESPTNLTFLPSQTTVTLGASLDN